VSYARPAKLFTDHETLITAEVGRLAAGSFQRVREAVLAVLIRLRDGYFIVLTIRCGGRKAWRPAQDTRHQDTRHLQCL